MFTPFIRTSNFSAEAVPAWNEPSVFVVVVVVVIVVVVGDLSLKTDIPSMVGEKIPRVRGN